MWRCYTAPIFGNLLLAIVEALGDVLPKPCSTDLPMITTIIPTFRRPKLLARAIRSALAQTFSDLSVAVLDNASGPETEELVAALASRDRRIAYFRHDRNIGGAANIAFGMSRVQTPYFSILCDDDVLLPRFYEAALERFARYPNAAFAGGSTLEVTERGDFVYAPAAYWSGREYFSPPDGAMRMMNGKHPTLTAVLFRTEALESVGPIDTAAGTLFDLDYFIRIAARYPISIFREPCGFFVRHAGSWSDSSSSIEADYDRLLAKYQLDQAFGDALRRAKARRLFQLTLKAVARNDDGAAAAYAAALARSSDRLQAAMARLVQSLAHVPGSAALLRTLMAARLTLLALECKLRLAVGRNAGLRFGLRRELTYFRALRDA